jgi:hypothetical protein
MSTWRLRFFVLLVAAASLAGCGGANSTSAVPNGFREAQSRSVPEVRSRDVPGAVDAVPQLLQTPALISINRNTSALQYWLISPTGGKTPQTVATNLGVSGAGAMAAHDRTLYIADGGTASIRIYDVATKTGSSLADPFGTPLDLAVGKDLSVYVANDAKPPNVAMYPAGSSPPVKLGCKLLSFIDGVAVNNEGDIFIYGFEKNPGPDGLFEIPNGPSGPEPDKCAHVSLKMNEQEITGYAFDPKTDDLVVLDDPDQCAGGSEGRMTIFPPPYAGTVGTSRILGGNCPGGLWLNADSTLVFYDDTDVSSSDSFIRQATFPEGKRMGTYFGGATAAFATIPNTLPN